MARVFQYFCCRREGVMYTVTFRFEEIGREPVTLPNIEPDQSLLEVALLNNIELHHNCGGVCSCSTCHVYIDKGGEHLEVTSDREFDFIEDAYSPRINSRLACQCILQEGSGEIEVTLPDQTIIAG